MRLKQASIVVLILAFLFSILVPSLGYAGFRKSIKKRVTALEEQAVNHEERITTLEELPPGEPGPPGPPGSTGPEGPAGQGCIKVYDSSEPPQYLGILLSMPKDTYIAEIFIPSLNLATTIVEPLLASEYGTGRLIMHSEIFFENSDCTGAAYLDYSICNVLYRQHRGGDTPQTYFYGVQPRIVGVTVWSELNDEGGCEFLGGLGKVLDAAHPVTEVPEEEIPFTLPVTLPLTYESQ